jgi:hypothetical protein
MSGGAKHRHSFLVLFSKQTLLYYISDRYYQLAESVIIFSASTAVSNQMKHNEIRGSYDLPSKRSRKDLILSR